MKVLLVFGGYIREPLFGDMPIWPFQNAAWAELAAVTSRTERHGFQARLQFASPTHVEDSTP